MSFFMNTLGTSIDRPPKRKLSTGAYAVIGLVMFALTIAVLYGEENWRGKRAWEAYKARVEAEGKSLDWQALIPEPVPDQENIFKAPGMEAFIKGNAPSSLSERIGRVNDRARTFETNNVLVARVTVLLENEPAASATGAAISVEQAASAINQRGKVMSGSSGIMLFTGKILTEGPLDLTVKGQTKSILKEFEQRVKDFGIRETEGRNIEVFLKSGVPAEAYLKAFEAEKAAFDELAAAIKRPFARLPGDYSVPFSFPIQNFVAMRTLAQTLGQAAQSYILLHNPEEALKSVTLIHESQRMITANPARKSMTLVAAMIHVAINGLYVSVIEDGERLGVWRDSDYATLQKQFASIELLPLVSDSFKSEHIGVIHLCLTSPLSKVFDFDKPTKWKFDLLPKGWMYQNIVRYGELMEEQIKALESTLPRIDPDIVKQAQEHLENELDRFSPYIFVARVAIPNTRKAFRTASKNQTYIQLGQVACGLERFRIAHGKFPEKLDQLSPQFLKSMPQDIINGTSPIYSRRENETYLLYSAGWNQKDDGGKELPDGEGDWVWNEHSTR
jgi:hypothetical protein